MIQEIVTDINDINNFNRRTSDAVEDIVADLPNVSHWNSHSSRRLKRDRFVILEDEDEENWLD